MGSKYLEKENSVIERLKKVDSVLSEQNYHDLYDVLKEMIEHFLACMFPYQYGDFVTNKNEESKRRGELFLAYDRLEKALSLVIDDEEKVEEYALNMIDKIPEVYELLQSDIKSGYEGDPAALSTDEVILCYPAFKAISIYRLAHILYEMGVPTLPRMMSEQAHKKTGIDIHPGATIGRSFFIDHGTGVVVGETCVIGDNVKLYQHVTLGAKSFAANDDGTLVKGIKRHPNIGNNVVIYAGATILGGDTYIGDNSVIGGNVWLTHSVPEGSHVYSNSSDR